MHNIADFVILGAQKAGTTSLYSYLGSHPQILIAKQKEINFFDLNFDKGLDWYRARFPSLEARRGCLVGEASPYYLFHPRVPERLAQSIPHAKLIVLLRDPVERAISHYYHEVRFGWESENLQVAITKESEILKGEIEKLLCEENYYSFNHQHYSYLSRGLYAEQLKRWHQYFPQEQIGVFRAEDLYANPASTVSQVLSFLGLPDYPLQEYRIYNEGIKRAEVPQSIFDNLVEYFQFPNQELERYLGRQFYWHHQKQKSKSPAIIVTGMHRSGTSLTAAFIQALGVNMGSGLLPADNANAKGYFEDIEILEFQRSLLRACCRANEAGWHDWGWMESELLDRHKFQDYASAARHLIQLRQSQGRMWGWKDPRTSLLLNFWHPLLPEAKYIFVYRFPWDVADSIRRINQPIFNRHPEYAARIWAFYNRHILDFYRNHSDRCILFHVDAIEHQPERLIQLLRDKLNISLEGDRHILNTVFEKHLLSRLPQDDTSAIQLQEDRPDCLALLAELENLADISSKSFSISLSQQVSKTSIEVSAIVPCFNHGEFLWGAIASVESSIGVNYEIIIVDDGSTDPVTQKILTSLEESGYRIIRQTNQGLAKARNHGISLSKGKYILPLDADNRIRPNYLRKGIEVLEHSPQIGIVYGDVEFFGEIVGIRRVPNFSLDILLIENYIDACAIIRKSVWEDCNGYDINMPDKLGYEDWDLWLSAVERGWQFFHIAEVLFDYHVRPQSMVSTCKIPANRRKLMQYLYQKHASLYTHRLKNIIVQKDYFLFTEQQRNNLLQSQLVISQSPWLPQQSYHLPLVSVCIPTHNGEEFLREALESILNQTYLNLEIIISDDASTDSTLAIANAFQQRLQQKFLGGVSIISHAQYGLVYNWNFCIAQSRGKYIKFLFQDDILEADCIEAMVSLAEQDEQIGMVFSLRAFLLTQEAANHPTLKIMSEAYKDSHRLWTSLQLIQEGKEFLSDPNLLEKPLNKIGEPSTVLVRKKIFHKIGLFDPQFRQLVDLDLWLRIMGHSKIGFINRVLSYFRLHLKQQTLRNADMGISDLLGFYRKLAGDPSYGFLPSNIRHLTFCSYIAMAKQRDRSLHLDESRRAKLCQIRREIAESWQIAADPQCEHVLLQTQLALLKTQIAFAPLTETEMQFVSKARGRLASSPKPIQMLLSALVFCRFDQLSYPIDEIPQWLLKHGMEILLQSPQFFQEVGEIDIYCRYLQNITNFLYEQIFSARYNREPNQDLQVIAASFIRHADFTPLQLTETSYKEVLTKRSEIFKFLLCQSQCDLEYQFVARSPDSKIRLGILTNSFASTPETYISLPLYEHLDREQFEVILYALTRSGEPIEQYCQSRSNSFNILSSNLKNNAEFIRSDDLDALFICADNLDINSQVSYLALHQLARFQIRYPSLPNTGEGSITNSLEVPLCISFGSDLFPAKLHASRQRFGIAEDAIVFVSGSHFSRITPELYHAWARICAAVPKSVLLVYPFFRSAADPFLVESFYDRICRVFELYKIERDRVLLFNTDRTIHREDIIQFLAIADIYLDSYPYSDWVAAVDALQAKLPVLTRQRAVASTSSLLQELNLEDLIAVSENAYIDAAISLGLSQELREHQRVKLALAMQQCPKFLDSVAQSKFVESLLTHLFYR